MKKLLALVFFSLFMVACSPSTSTNKLACTVADEGKGVVITHDLKNEKITSTELKMSLKKDHFKGDSEDDIKEELKILFSKDVEFEITGDVVSFALPVDEATLSVFTSFEIPYDSSLVEASDIDGITALYENADGVCKVIEVE